MYLSITQATRPLTGEVRIPHSKYHAHRGLILASLAPGRSTIVGASDAGHVQYTVDLLRSLGVRIVRDGDTFTVDGGHYHPARDEITAGSSGTTLYFMIGLACLADEPITVTGQKYFQRRPVAALLDALGQMGVRARSATGAPPIRVEPGRPTGGEVHIPGTLSQWVSGLLLVAPFASAPTTVIVDGELNEKPYVELTVDMMAQFGLHVDVAEDWRRFEIAPDQQPVATTVRLPPDIGSAAFALAAAGLHESDVLLRGMSAVAAEDTDHPEAEIVDIVRAMGVDLAIDEGTGFVRATHDGSALTPVAVDCRDLPDALPVLATMASFANGTSVFDNIAHVRLKESDRASAMLQLNRMGARLDLHGDRLEVRGVPSLTGAALSSFNDHRVLMSLAVAASRARGETRLTYPNAYRISYPTFLDAMNTIGIPMSAEHEHRTAGASPRAVDQLPADTRPIGEWVRRWAIERPHDIAVIDAREGETHEHSWLELSEAADELSAALLDLGVQRGERVAFQLPNWFEFVVATVAIAQIDAVCCPLMPMFREREVSFALRRSQARVLLIPEEFRGRNYRQQTAGVLSREPRASSTGGTNAPELSVEHVVVIPAADPPPLPADDSVRWHSYRDLIAAAQVSVDRLAARRPEPDSTAQLLFTSGTSGEPKGVLHTHGVLTRAARMQAAHLGLTDADRVYVPSPLAHQTGFLYGMWLAITLGATQVLQPIWNAGRALRLLREHACTFVQAATPFLADLVGAVDQGDRAPTSLRVFVATGAAVPRGLAERATRLLSTTVCGAWGTTETCLGSLAAPTDEPGKVWGTDGRALDGIELRITDDNGRVLGADTEGNFEVRGPTFFTGYLDHPDWTAEAFTADGFFRTGDLATIDESGFVRITGRVRDVINRGGEKVPVSEIEQVLYEHPSIEDVAIVAMPDARLGERACAFATLRPHASLTFPAMQKFLDVHQVAKQYWPERLEVIDAMPRNPAGKIRKFMLRDRARSLRPQRQEESS